VGERTSVLRRTADDTDPIERIVAAYDGGLEPLLCLTKHDLGEAAEIVAYYTPLGLRVVKVSRADGDSGFDELRAALSDRTSVLFGQSGWVSRPWSTVLSLALPGPAERSRRWARVATHRHRSLRSPCRPADG